MARIQLVELTACEQAGADVVPGTQETLHLFRQRPARPRDPPATH